jgi:hypothetical protein
MTLTTVNAGMLDTQAQYNGFKNRILNGNMVLDQRNAGAAVTVTAGYSLDRWLAYEGTDGAITIQQVSDAPAGFSNSLKVTTTTADASIGATQFCYLEQRIEGYNFSDFNFGTASAQSTTISFQVKSSLTGTFGGVIMNNANNRCYPFTYTVNAANTWETETITIAGDTTGTWVGATNGIGLRVIFGLGMGSTYSGTAGAWVSSEYYSTTGAVAVISTLNATWQVTGVQLEKGSTATSFDYRPYSTELQLAQRYYCKSFSTNTVPADGAAGAIQTTCGPYSTAAAYVSGIFPYPVVMRSNPSVVFYSSGNAGTGVWDIYKGSWLGTITTGVNVASSTHLNVFITSSGMTQWAAYLVAGHFTASAEL